MCCEQTFSVKVRSRMTRRGACAMRRRATLREVHYVAYHIMVSEGVSECVDLYSA